METMTNEFKAEKDFNVVETYKLAFDCFQQLRILRDNISKNGDANSVNTAKLMYPYFEGIVKDLRVITKKHYPNENLFNFLDEKPAERDVVVLKAADLQDWPKESKKPKKNPMSKYFAMQKAKSNGW
jgi:hypothetical protein